MRIVLVDDHEMFREGLRAMLEQQTDLEVVGEAGNGREAVDLVTKLSLTSRRHGHRHARSQRH